MRFTYWDMLSRWPAHDLHKTEAITFVHSLFGSIMRLGLGSTFYSKLIILSRRSVVMILLYGPPLFKD